MRRKTFLPAVGVMLACFWNLAPAADAPNTLADKRSLAIEPVPWQDGEEVVLRLSTQAGAEIGGLFYRASAIEQEKESAWRIECHQVIPINNYLQYTRVDAGAADFAPIWSRTKNSMLGDFRAVYAPTSVELTVVGQGKETQRRIGLTGPVYDNEQVLYLLRRLPLKEGYDATFSIFPVMSGAAVDCGIEVAGRERVIAPAGEFDCFKIELKVPAQGVAALSHTLWLSADERRLLVKYDAVNAVMELAEVSVVDPAQPAVFDDPTAGIHLAAPAGWHFYQSPLRGTYMANVQLLPPEQIAWAVFMANDLPATGATVRQIAEKDAQAVANFLADYVVKPESWTDLTVAGMPAVSYVAEYRDKGIRMTEYRTYILGGGGIYWAVFRIEKELFGAQRESFDKVLAGFEVRDAVRPPVVVGSVPGNFATDVPATLGTVTATFDRAMRTDGYSWTQYGNGETFPALNGKIQWSPDRRTCTLPVALEAGKVYWVGVNSEHHFNFRAADGASAKPYVILFATAGPDGKPTPIPEDLLARAKVINGAVSSADKAESQRLSARGWALWQQGEKAEAERVFEAALTKDPANEAAWNGLGWARMNQGKQAAAKEAFEQCLKVNPNLAGALNGLGWIAKAEGRTREAIRYWEKAVAVSPSATAALNGLATTYLELEDYQNAVKYFEMIQSQMPNDPNVKRQLDEARAKLKAQ